MFWNICFLASLFFICYAKPLDENTQAKSPVPSATTAASVSKSAGNVAVETPVQRIFLDEDSCDPNQQKLINIAWQDAALLARVAIGGRYEHSPLVPTLDTGTLDPFAPLSTNYDYDTPKKQWFGADYNWPGIFPISQDYRDIINNNIMRASALHTDSVQSGVWIYISCPKKHEECSPGTIAASQDQHRFFWINHVTLFCPLFFERDSMTKALDKVQNNPREQVIMENYWGNQGYTFLHETYHYGNSVAQPRTGDECYGPLDCWKLAAGIPKPSKPDQITGTKTAYWTADSYSLYSMAIYVQQYFKTSSPPTPGGGGNSAVLSQTNGTSMNNPSLGQTPYKALNSGLEDLLNTTNNIDLKGTGLNPRWKLMVGPPTVASTSAPPANAATLSPTCNMTAISNIPFKVFTGTAGSVFGGFCDAVDKAPQTKISWNVDSFGKQKSPSRRRHDKRTPPPNPNTYKSYNIQLDWQPTSGTCKVKCNDAYKHIALSPCGHSGSQQNAMVESANFDIGCGTYSYKITGGETHPPPQSSPASPSSKTLPNPAQNTDFVPPRGSGGKQPAVI